MNSIFDQYMKERYGDKYKEQMKSFTITELEVAYGKGYDTGYKDGLVESQGMVLDAMYKLHSDNERVK